VWRVASVRLFRRPKSDVLFDEPLSNVGCGFACGTYGNANLKDSMPDSTG